MLKTPTGWLAVAPDDSTLAIGVAAAEPGEARERFAVELNAWHRLLATNPDPEPSVG